jgi:hypothetical protein
MAATQMVLNLVRRVQTFRCTRRNRRKQVATSAAKRAAEERRGSGGEGDGRSGRSGCNKPRGRCEVEQDRSRTVSLATMDLDRGAQFFVTLRLRARHLWMVRTGPPSQVSSGRCGNGCGSRTQGPQFR